MKKAILLSFAMLTLSAGLLSCHAQAMNIMENGTETESEVPTETMTFDVLCVVKDIVEDKVTVECQNGELYSFYGDGYEVGDLVNCTFNGNQIINAVTATEIMGMCYMICDVVGFDEEYFYVEFLTGQVEQFPLSMVADPPINDDFEPYFELVCFRIEYREHTTHYKVVALR